MSTYYKTSSLGDASGDLSESLMSGAKYCYDTTLHPTSIDLISLIISESGSFLEIMSDVPIELYSQPKCNLSIPFQQPAAQKVIPHGDHDKSAELFADLFLGIQTVILYFGRLSTPPTKTDIKVKVDLFILGRFGPK